MKFVFQCEACKRVLMESDIPILQDLGKSLVGLKTVSSCPACWDTEKISRREEEFVRETKSFCAILREAAKEAL